MHRLPLLDILEVVPVLNGVLQSSEGLLVVGVYLLARIAVVDLRCFL